MLNTSLTLGCFAVAALSGYQYIRMRRSMPVTAMHLGVSAVFFTALGLWRLYETLFNSSLFQKNVYQTRIFNKE